MIELKRCMKRFKRGGHCFQSSLDHRVGLRFGCLITVRDTNVALRGAEGVC